MASCSSWVTSTIVWPCRLRSSRRRQGDLAVAPVERAGRFVGEQDGGSVDDRAGDRDALALAAAQGRRELPRLVGQAELDEQLVDALTRRRPR